MELMRLLSYFRLIVKFKLNPMTLGQTVAQMVFDSNSSNFKKYFYLFPRGELEARGSEIFHANNPRSSGFSDIFIIYCTFDRAILHC